MSSNDQLIYMGYVWPKSYIIGGIIMKMSDFLELLNSWLKQELLTTLYIRFYKRIKDRQTGFNAYNIFLSKLD